MQADELDCLIFRNRFCYFFSGFFSADMKTDVRGSGSLQSSTLKIAIKT